MGRYKGEKIGLTDVVIVLAMLAFFVLVGYVDLM